MTGFATQDLRRPILELFAAVQEPYQHILLYDIVERCGCQKIKHEAYAALHKAEHAEYMRGWSKRRPNKVKASRQRYRMRNLEQERARQAEYSRKRRAAKKVANETL